MAVTINKMFPVYPYFRLVSPNIQTGLTIVIILTFCTPALTCRAGLAVLPVLHVIHLFTTCMTCITCMTFLPTPSPTTNIGGEP
jgi:hypothetical protein